MKNVNDLISKVDIVSIISNFGTLVKTGTSYKTLCNVHGDKSPSLSINPRKQIYKCFVCDHGGNALDYLLWAQKFTWNEAIEYLIKESGSDEKEFKDLISSKFKSEKESEIINCLKDASDIFNHNLNISLENESDITTFIKKRKLTSEIINKFKLGYAPVYNEEANYIKRLTIRNYDQSVLINSSLTNEKGDYPFFINRLIFPIYDEYNNIVAFSGRLINETNGNEPKYLNSRETLVFKKNRIMYNYNNAYKYDQIIIVEGYMDVIAFSKIGMDNAIALMGLNLSDENVSKLKRHKEILIFLDNDRAGVIGALKILNKLLINDLKVFVINNDLSKDPDEIINSDANNGKNVLLDIIENNKVRPVDFIFSKFTSNIDENNFEEIKAMLVELAKYSIKFDDFIIIELINKVSAKFKIEKDIIGKYFRKTNNVVQFKEQNYNNTNIEYKQDIEIEFKEPLNINKILISIWQNPSFLKSQNIGSIKWPKAENKKVFQEIKDFHEKGIPISKITIDFINKNQELFKSKQSFPNDIASFDELIYRSEDDTLRLNLQYIDDLIENGSSMEQERKLLESKLKLIKKRKE